MDVKSFFVEGKDLLILHTKYHGRWWPGDVRGQGINSHGIDLVLSQYSGSSTKKD